MEQTSTRSHLLEYPRAMCFLFSCIIAYFLFSTGEVDMLVHALNGKGYISAFIGGLLFSFGFTSPFAIAIFLAIAHQVDPFIASVLAGFGAFISDFCIFQFVESSLHEEIGKFRQTRIFRYFHSILHHEKVSHTVRQYLLWSIAGLVIASPLPDELAVTMISSIAEMKKSAFALLCFTLNTLGILMLLLSMRILV